MASPPSGKLRGLLLFALVPRGTKGYRLTWNRLVATIGNKSSARRVNRKAIQEVDVRRACGKILEPGAPIALRLQDNLLYGVSRVHNQQCTYLVTDAKRMQGQMNFFFRNFANNQDDPDAGMTRYVFANKLLPDLLWPG
jgi:hypothetical protein